MNYRITITRTEPNPNFAVEMEAYEREQQGHRYGGGRDLQMPPLPEVVKNVLAVELTEEEFKAVKGSVIQVFL